VKIRVGRATQGRAGKGVTTVTGLPLSLAEIEALGLDLLEVRQLPPEAGSPESGDACSP